ncbi:hypothetical protein [Roseateles puraquae]|nr:hypothetical protein [Roseateles puraquae]
MPKRNPTPMKREAADRIASKTAIPNGVEALSNSFVSRADAVVQRKVA